MNQNHSIVIIRYALSHKLKFNHLKFRKAAFFISFRPYLSIDYSYRLSSFLVNKSLL